MWRRVLRHVDRFLTVGAAPEPVTLVDFSRGSAAALKPWRVFSDQDFGGLSRGALRLEQQQQQQHQQHQQHQQQQQGDASWQYAVLEGRYSKALGDNCDLVRSGYIGMSTLLPRAVDLSLHDELELTLRAHTPHSYVASLRTEQYTKASGEEAWQALITPSRVGEWETLRLPLKSLVFTFRGRVASSTNAPPGARQHPGGPLLAPRPTHTQAGTRTLGPSERARVVGLGLTLAAAEDMPDEGDFRLDLAGVRARAARTDSASDLVRAQFVEVSAEDEARMEWEQRALEAAKRLSAPGQRRRRADGLSGDGGGTG